jgi:hypothetical protein
LRGCGWRDETNRRGGLAVALGFFQGIADETHGWAWPARAEEESSCEVAKRISKKTTGWGGGLKAERSVGYWGWGYHRGDGGSERRRSQKIYPQISQMNMD